MLVTSLVLGVFDYCNVLLIGLQAITLAKFTYLPSTICCTYNSQATSSRRK